MSKPSSTSGGYGRGGQYPYWCCISCDGWTHCHRSTTACHSCGQPPSKAAARHFKVAPAAPAAAPAAAPRRGWAATPTPLTVESFVTVPHGKKATRRANAAARAAGSAPPPAPGGQQPLDAPDVVDVDEEATGPTIADVTREIAGMEPMEHLPGVASQLAEHRKKLLSLQAERRAAKDPKFRLLDAIRVGKQRTEKEAKSLKALQDLCAAHELLVEKHNLARAAAEAVLAADKLLTAAAKKELGDASEASSAAVAPELSGLSPAAEVFAARIRADTLALAAQLAVDNAAAPPPVPVPSLGPAEGGEAAAQRLEQQRLAAIAAEAERAEKVRLEAAAEQERIDAEQAALDEEANEARAKAASFVAASDLDVGMADAEKKRLSAEADLAEGRAKRCRAAVGAAGIKRANG
jgi:hypothetical protein